MEDWVLCEFVNCNLYPLIQARTYRSITLSRSKTIQLHIHYHNQAFTEAKDSGSPPPPLRSRPPLLRLLLLRLPASLPPPPPPVLLFLALKRCISTSSRKKINNKFVTAHSLRKFYFPHGTPGHVLGFCARGTRGRSSSDRVMGEESEVSDSVEEPAPSCSRRSSSNSCGLRRERVGYLSRVIVVWRGRFIGVLAGLWRHLVVFLDLSIEHLDFEKSENKKRTNQSTNKKNYSPGQSLGPFFLQPKIN